MKLFPATITTVSLLLLTCICTSIIYWLWFRYEQRLLQRKPELDHTVTHKSSSELESAPVMFHSTHWHASANDAQHTSQLANNFRLPRTPKKRLINSELNRTAGFFSSFLGGGGGGSGRGYINSSKNECRNRHSLHYFDQNYELLMFMHSSVLTIRHHLVSGNELFSLSQHDWNRISRQTDRQTPLVAGGRTGSHCDRLYTVVSEWVSE